MNNLNCLSHTAYAAGSFQYLGSSKNQTKKELHVPRTAKQSPISFAGSQHTCPSRARFVNHAAAEIRKVTVPILSCDRIQTIVIRRIFPLFSCLKIPMPGGRVENSLSQTVGRIWVEGWNISTRTWRRVILSETRIADKHTHYLLQDGIAFV